MTTQTSNTQRKGGAQTADAGRRTMPNEQLDQVIAEVIGAASKPLTLPQIEGRVLEKGIKADTFDVQRAVQRLVEAGRAKVTPRFQIVAA